MPTYLSYNPSIALQGTRNGYHLAITPEGAVYRYNHASPLSAVCPRPSEVGVAADFSNLAFPIPFPTAKQISLMASFPALALREKEKLDQWRFVARVCNRTVFLEDQQAAFGNWAAAPSITADHFVQLSQEERLNVIRAVNSLAPQEQPEEVHGCRYNPSLDVFIP